MTTTRITTPDNGYFAVATRPCGHTVRITTEYLPRTNYGPTGRPTAAAMSAAIAAADRRPCRQCDGTAHDPAYIAAVEAAQD